MKVLVLGKSGQVARELAALSGGAVQVDCMGRDEADLTTGDGVAEAERRLSKGYDAVVNAAAFTAVDRAETEQDAATMLNVIAPSALSRAAHRAGVPFVHISTDYVFPGTGDAPWTETDRVVPLNTYGRSKASGEETVLGSMAPCAILRTSWVFSAHGSNFVKTMLRLSETKDALSVVSDQIGGPTPARAIAEASVRIASRLRVDPGLSGVYHFAGAPDVSWADFAREVFRQAGRSVQVTDIPTAEYPTPAARPLNSRLDCGKIEAAFGIARPDWKAGLADVLATLGAKA
ncbi:dTDP-4-dehydrorhamnose reductase [Anianabacter salinae]|uniref:dTDP-4-dehydrorhamnose reductase n=1 Tax=Anianabacter salinae TaxID=2851023 RepID=UPI00225E44B0|nr:dTDP-4-dehydrorhamnose reductase [Anianabacter salinae]MBV0913465.1 dTDP-4-dehydrorhamnose reductase [Anianabacter salinae]